LEAKKRNNEEKEKNCWKSSGPLPDGKEALISKTLLKEKKEAPQRKCWALGSWHRSIDFFV
jgi:hypothetical protein